MNKKQRNIIVILVITVVLGLIGAVAGLWWHRHQEQQSSLRTAQLSDQAGTDNTGADTLSVSSTDLGQLETNSGQNKNSKSSSSSSGLNPATFSQYDKYKNDSHALIAEMQPGNGTALQLGQKASIYYKGWLTNGALVDQSPVNANGQLQPLNLTLGSGQVIPGLEEGIAGMKTGGRRLVIVPPVVGYGAEGRGTVPPNAVLVFEIQLINVQ